MNFEVYCDESGLEALSNKSAHKYTAIGGVWLPADKRLELKQEMNAIKERHGIKGELKWNKLSPAFYAPYSEVVNYFFQADYLRFRVILIEADKVDNIKFHDADNELSFYKFYYQLLQHWIFDFNSYAIHLDLKINRNKGRLEELKRVLNNANLTSEIAQVQGLPSEQSLGIQLADILTGLSAAKFNENTKSEAKAALIALVEEKIGKSIAPTPKWSEKFNVFKINLKGGW
jgi:Protein of unknown function (DUF3800)